MTQLGIYCGPDSWDGSDLGGDTRNTLDVETHLWNGSHTFAVQRHYNTWPASSPNQKERDALAAGRNVYVEIAADVKQGASWAQIAAGKQDAEILRMGTAYRVWWLARERPDRFSFVFSHEPDADRAQGTPGEFRAAFARFTDLWRSINVPCLYVFNLNGVWSSDPGIWAPVPTSYDLVGSDRYNHGQHWRSFAQLHTPAHDFAVKVGKPLCIGETGTIERPGDPNGKAAWITDIGRVCARWNVVFVAYTHKAGKGDYRVSTSPQSADAFRALVTIGGMT